jgi:nitrate/nitrite transporter NarK
MLINIVIWLTHIITHSLPQFKKVFSTHLKQKQDYCAKKNNAYSLARIFNRHNGASAGFYTSLAQFFSTKFSSSRLYRNKRKVPFLLKLP